MYQSNSIAGRTTLGTLMGAGIGAVITAPAILAAVMSGGAGHGTYVAAHVLFPFSMLLTRFEGGIGPIAIGAGLLEFPLYGALVGRAVVLKTDRVVFFAAAAHLVASLACFSGQICGFS
ncbi:hypothetical protein NZL82_00665 [Sphingomonas sanguinis]|uniref:hypothetical protein n=1 Tax=Sphingomonas sp. LC-1 TaxID=3110957 RepID=UPI0021BBAAD1|nr:hypothetical protein [Sphingomonas sp. LC-1]MCT8000385.1 hypothetical protein [Sphingomonas sp. LC-1]